MRLWHANPPYRLNSSHVSLPDVGRIRIAASSTSELFSKLFLYQLVTYGTGLTWILVNFESVHAIRLVVPVLREPGTALLCQLGDYLPPSHGYSGKGAEVLRLATSTHRVEVNELVLVVVERIA